MAHEEMKYQMVCEEMSTQDMFLQELRELFHKYNATLGGCGCCGSPNITVNDCSFTTVIINAEGGSYDSYDENADVKWGTKAF